MMVSAFLVMLGQVPIGIWLTSWIPETGFISNFRLEHISYWILTQPNAAAQRGINFGLAVGAMAMRSELRSPCFLIRSRSAFQRSGLVGVTPQRSNCRIPSAARVSLKEACGPNFSASSQLVSSAWK